MGTVNICFALAPSLMCLYNMGEDNMDEHDDSDNSCALYTYFGIITYKMDMYMK